MDGFNDLPEVSSFLDRGYLPFYAKALPPSHPFAM